MRFLLLDRINEITIGETIEGVKCWSLSNEIFNDHFPGSPIVPGVLLVESMAQLLGVLIEKSYPIEFPNQKGIHPLLSMIGKAKLREMVIPGDQCILKAKLKSIDLKRATGSAEVFVEGKLKAQADLVFVVASNEDLPQNDFIDRRKEYLQILLANTKIYQNVS